MPDALDRVVGESVPRLRRIPHSRHIVIEPENHPHRSLQLTGLSYYFRASILHDISPERVLAGVLCGRFPQRFPPGFFVGKVSSSMIIINNNVFPCPERCRKCAYPSRPEAKDEDVF